MKECRADISEMARALGAETKVSSCPVNFEQKCRQLLTGSSQNVGIDKDCRGDSPVHTYTLAQTFSPATDHKHIQFLVTIISSLKQDTKNQPYITQMLF